MGILWESSSGMRSHTGLRMVQLGTYTFFMSSEEVALQLVESKCLPMLLYCLEVCRLAPVSSVQFI